tara:strand:- start:211 stop:345 length:135 start_codon:yes stop_codon:yes gene_type:complete
MGRRWGGDHIGDSTEMMDVASRQVLRIAGEKQARLLKFSPIQRI